MRYETETYRQLKELYDLTLRLQDECGWPNDVIEGRINMALVFSAGGVRNDEEANRLRQDVLAKQRLEVINSLGFNEERMQNFRRRIETSSGYKLLSSKPEFKTLLESFARKASRKSGGAFSDPRAWFWFISACALCTAIYEHRTSNKTAPRIAYKPTKEKARKAVSLLLSCQAEGLVLSKYSTSITYDELKDLKKKLDASIDTHEARHNDQYVHARHAVRDFAQWLHLKFGITPPILIENFAATLDYYPKHLDLLLREWRLEFAANTPSNLKT